MPSSSFRVGGAHRSFYKILSIVMSYTLHHTLTAITSIYRRSEVCGCACVWRCHRTPACHFQQAGSAGSVADPGSQTTNKPYLDVYRALLGAALPSLIDLIEVCLSAYSRAWMDGRPLSESLLSLRRVIGAACHVWPVIGVCQEMKEMRQETPKKAAMGGSRGLFRGPRGLVPYRAPIKCTPRSY